jgi:hypothetical protein
MDTGYVYLWVWDSRVKLELPAGKRGSMDSRSGRNGTQYELVSKTSSGKFFLSVASSLWGGQGGASRQRLESFQGICCRWCVVCLFCHSLAASLRHTQRAHTSGCSLPGALE